MNKLAVIAIGGNSLIKDKKHQFVKDQYDAICETVKYVVDIIEKGYEVIITHGNGPQVGFIMRRSEIAQKTEHMHPVPLVNCDADTQGAIGYQIQQAVQNELYKRNIKKRAVSIVTQVEVDINDSAFKKPIKPIGEFYDKEQVDKMKEANPTWIILKDSNRGYRRVVASPTPQNIIEIDAIKTLIENKFVVIAVGGGGIPVVKDNKGIIHGINAVIDKDYATSLLAIQLNADLFIISTAVKNVYTNYGKQSEKEINHITLEKLKILKKQGHFSKGSMLPKINSVINFVEQSKKEAIITNPSNLKKAIEKKAGTFITYD